MGKFEIPDSAILSSTVRRLGVEGPGSYSERYRGPIDENAGSEDPTVVPTLSLIPCYGPRRGDLAKTW